MDRSDTKSSLSSLRQKFYSSREQTLQLRSQNEQKSASQADLNHPLRLNSESRKHLSNPESQSNENLSNSNLGMSNKNRFRNFNERNDVSYEIKNIIVSHSQSISKKLLDMGIIFSNINSEMNVLKKQNIYLDKKNRELEIKINKIMAVVSSMTKQVKEDNVSVARNKNSTNHIISMNRKDSNLCENSESDDSETDELESEDSDSSLSSNRSRTTNVMKKESPRSRSSLPLSSSETGAKSKNKFAKVGSFKFAREKERSEYNKLLDLHNSSLILTTNDSPCENCNTIIRADEGVVLHQCGHTFCLVCIQEQISRNISKPDVRCPYINQHYRCQLFLEENEIKKVLPDKAYERRMHLLCKSVPGAVYCLGEDCTNMVIVDDDVYNFTCSACQSVNCLECMTIHPDGGTCRLTANLRSHEERLKSFENWKSIAEDDLVENTESFQCPICLSNCDVGEGVVLKQCLHAFCKQCLKEHINHTEVGEILCPFVNDDYACEDFLEPNEIKALLSKQEFDKYLTKTINLAESTMKDTFHCLTPDCPGWCVLEDYTLFDCPICGHLSCSDCKAIHDNLTCKQHKENLLEKSDQEKQADIRLSEGEIQSLIAQGLAMHCFSCGALIQKVDGCNHVTCRCKAEINWRTKQRWDGLY